MDAPPSLAAHLAAVRAAAPADYPGVPADVFEQLRADLLRFYDGVTPVETVADPSGTTIDVIPFAQFPTVRAARAAGHAVAAAGPRPTGFGSARAADAAPDPPADGVVRVARRTLADAVRVWKLGAVKAPPAGA